MVFWGDHGYQLGEHTEWMKTTNFEIANWVPLMLRVPGATDKEGSETNALVEMVDLFPTLVEAAGLPPLDLCPEEESTSTLLCTEGSSLMPLVRDNDQVQWRDAAFWQYRGKGGGYGGHPTVIPTTMGYTVRTQRYSYTEWVYIDVLDEEVKCSLLNLMRSQDQRFFFPRRWFTNLTGTTWTRRVAVACSTWWHMI